MFVYFWLTFRRSLKKLYEHEVFAIGTATTIEVIKAEAEAEAVKIGTAFGVSEESGA